MLRNVIDDALLKEVYVESGLHAYLQIYITRFSAVLDGYVDVADESLLLCGSRDWVTYATEHESDCLVMKNERLSDLLTTHERMVLDVKLMQRAANICLTLHNAVAKVQKLWYAGIL